VSWGFPISLDIHHPHPRQTGALRNGSAPSAAGLTQ
jgi:hypothetical protein